MERTNRSVLCSSGYHVYRFRVSLFAQKAASGEHSKLQIKKVLLIVLTEVFSTNRVAQIRCNVYRQMSFQEEHSRLHAEEIANQHLRKDIAELKNAQKNSQKAETVR